MKLLQYLAVLNGVVWISSCVDPITDLEQGEYLPEVVIEAKLITAEEGSFVKISRSIALENEVVLNPITNARVCIGSPGESTDTLVSAQNGYYTLPHLQGESGKTYLLQVWVDGTIYEAQSYLSPVGKIDSLSCKLEYNEYTDSAEYHLRMYASRASATEDSYYMLKTWRNDTLLSEIDVSTVFSDSYITSFNGILFPSNFGPGDTIRVGLYSISEEIFYYFAEIFNLHFNNLNTIYQYPTNPPGNISNGSLGYFQTSDVSFQEIVIE